MYLESINIKNFRLFDNFDLEFNKGLNLLVGENDSGKTALIDAVRLVLDTNSAEWVRFVETDFLEGTDTLSIKLKFSDLSIPEQAVFPEHLTYEKDSEGKLHPSLYVTLNATIGGYHGRSGQFVKTEIRSGQQGEGPLIEREPRMYLSTTYLKPLRDVEGELSAGRSSRLSQLLSSPKSIGKEAFGIERLINVIINANQSIKSDTSVQGAQTSVDSLLKKLTFHDRPFTPVLDMLGSKAFTDMTEVEKNTLFKAILERLSLNLDETGKAHGLGYSNLLFMAAELMLLTQPGDGYPLLLIEEPEAHLHPQLQMKFLKYLTEEQPNLQCILSTHSPNLASKAPLESLIIVNSGHAYPLRKGCTHLSDDDYPFLEKFLDVSKANMFFAKGVLMVEGDGENILLPTIAELIGRPLENYGVSIVNIGSLAYKRYAKIYRVKGSDKYLPVKVACITDLDIWPDKAEKRDDNPIGFKVKKEPSGSKTGNLFRWSGYYENKPEALSKWIETKTQQDGDNVKTFISEEWTFEYCLAKSGISHLLYKSINDVEEYFLQLSGDTDEKAIQCEERAIKIYKMIENKSSGKTKATYELVDLLKKEYKGRASDLRKALPVYIVEAIEYVTEEFPHESDGGDTQ